LSGAGLPHPAVAAEIEPPRHQGHQEGKKRIPVVFFIFSWCSWCLGGSIDFFSPICLTRHNGTATLAA
ncbi:MAG: hypothetical protein M3176_15520, partial [Chloroflexota bacterium]|nr:hypothetical protein [Chloroflexota bacterium]